MSSSPKTPKAVDPVKPVKAASVYDTADATVNDMMAAKQSFLGSQLAGEDDENKTGGFLGR